MTRQIPKDIESYPFDLIVVGAGINGSGIARDAAMRGLKVLLLDKGDISDGTTQWATRLIHGGLRYLEHYEVPLVRESLRDREILLHIAPHLVKPLGFLVPVYDRSKRPPWMIRLGMIAYDTLSFDSSMSNHKMFSRDATLDREPGLNSDGLEAAAFYYDAQVEFAERLAVENAVSAKEHGATVITHAKVENLLREGGAVSGVEFSDTLDGEGKKYTARAAVTVNVAGPWVDEVLGGGSSFGFTEGNGGSDGEERMIGGTKGSHIVVDPFPGAPKDEALYVEARKDGRPYFIVPWNGRYLIGTTDFRYKDDLDYVSADDNEIDYLIEETNYVIPSANLTRDSVLFTYSGVRPLPYAPEGSESSISRSHVVFDHAKGTSTAGGKLHKSAAAGGEKVDGLISIIGGKLTTYRNLSRQTTDKVFGKLRRPSPPSATHRIPLPGGETDDFEAFSAEFKATSDLTDMLSTRLLKLYGTRSPKVVEMAGDDSSLKMPLVPNPTVETAVIGAEILHAFENELAVTLADALLRRTMAGMGPRVGLDVDEAAADVAAKHLGWSDERKQKEISAYRRYVERYRPKDTRQMDTPKT